MTIKDVNLSGVCFFNQTICPVDGGPCSGVECWYPGEFCILRQIISEDD